MWTGPEGFIQKEPSVEDQKLPFLPRHFTVEKTITLRAGQVLTVHRNGVLYADGKPGKPTRRVAVSERGRSKRVS